MKKQSFTRKSAFTEKSEFKDSGFHPIPTRLFGEWEEWERSQNGHPLKIIYNNVRKLIQVLKLGNHKNFLKYPKNVL